METIAIIGGMYGDEGKGLMTDYMCDQMLKNHTRGAVVRAQGGAQSGHTVVTPDGHRHIFSHFGSGTLLGVPTILSSKFVCNPILFNSEYWELHKQVKDPDIMIDKDSYISTVYDVEFNRELERSRGEKRHGSVGVGFGETIEREEVAELSFRYKDLYKPDRFILDKLEEIRQYYIERTQVLNIALSDVINNEHISKMMLIDLVFFRRRTKTYDHKEFDFLVFEGGQGLGLDMEYGSFPHVTRSRTGIHNAKEFCDKHGTELEKVVYVIRAYTTRHGAGPLDNESSCLDFVKLDDETNTENEFQGKLRLAPLDLDNVFKLAYLDIKGAGMDGCNHNLAVTCMDQIHSAPKAKYYGSLVTYSEEGFSKMIKSIANYVSFGPTRNDVRRIT